MLILAFFATAPISRASARPAVVPRGSTPLDENYYQSALPMHRLVSHAESQLRKRKHTFTRLSTFQHKTIIVARILIEDGPWEAIHIWHKDGTNYVYVVTRNVPTASAH